MTRFLLGIGVVVCFVTQSFAATLAVIDSGVDYKHKTLSAKMWSNPNSQTVDADGTVYKEDLHGWNFAEKNNQIIDYKYLGTFSEDCYKIFHVQAKILQGTNTPEEKAWYDAKKKDQAFLPELQKFGNFVHGSHVSGISTSEAAQSKVVALKLIPTAPPGGRAAQLLEKLRADGRDTEATDPFVKMFLGMLAKQQAAMLTTVGKYTAAVKSEVANGSFGTSVNAVKPTVEQLLKQFGKDASEPDLTEYATYLVSEILNASKDFVAASPNTLFVFAAGNDGTNNDQLPVSPANLKGNNSITVAATVGYQAMASFTNYGAKMVEVAAPGVAIVSTIPGDQTLPMSGTSMAAPFVTNVAGLIKDANTRLTPADIKKVLMETVDVKPFLAGKVVTGGIVNKDRAVKAAELSNSMDLAAAIASAKVQVANVREARFVSMPTDIMVTPLPDLLF